MSNAIELVELSNDEKEVHRELIEVVRGGDMDRVREIIAEYPRLLNSPGHSYGAALSVAARFGARGIAEALLEAGALVDPPCESPTQLPIAVAISWRHLDFAEWLVSQGASLDAALDDSNASATLWHACLPSEDLGLAEFVLAASARLDDPKKSLAGALSRAVGVAQADFVERVLDTADELDVSLAEELFDSLEVALRLREDCARLLLERGARLPAGSELSHECGAKLWHSAINSSEDWKVPLLLEAGFDIAGWESRYGSLLVGGIEDDSTRCKLVGLMLDNGLDPNLPGGEETTRRVGRSELGTPLTPIYDALREGRADIYRALVKKGANLADPSSLALPLFSTPGILKLNEKELRALAAAGHDVASTCGWRGSALHCAVRYGADAETAERLIALGVPLGLLDSEGRPPLHWAIEENKTLAKLLVEKGANPLQEDEHGRSALDFATSRPGNKKIAKFMQERLAESGVEVKIDTVQLYYEEPYAAALREAFEGLGAAQQKAWQELLSLASETNSTRPSKTFLKKALAHIEAAGRGAVRAGLLEALPAYKEKIPAPDDLDEFDWHDPWSTTEMNVRALRGLLWACSHFRDAEMSAALRIVATAAFKKVPNVGMRNAKVGNAALNSLAAMDQIGLRQIVILREQTKYNPAKVSIERVLTRVSKELDVSPDELAEMATSDFGLHECGVHRIELGEFRAELSVPGPGRTELLWYKGEKAQKTVPAAVKKDFPAELKALKVLAKDLQQATLAVRSRLEKQYLEPTTWELATWRERYLDHAVAGVLARRLVWRMRSGDDGDWNTVLFSASSESGFIDVQGRPAASGDDVQVQLWHPLHDKTESVLAWRRRLGEEDIVQPFKQAHREVYVVTDAERTTNDYSLRFADQILGQAHLHALSAQRAWTQVRGGSWDGGDQTDVYRSIPSAKLSVVYTTEPMEDFGISDYGIYLYLRGGEVRFYGEPDEDHQQGRVAMAAVPPLIFSEIMRDVDLFVSVANAANDPQWEHRLQINDWDARLAEELRASGETRRETLEALMPKLKVADRLSLDGRFLVVRGDVMSYRIHLGSANIMMEDGQYLCIVKRRDLSKGVALPYEGDSKLSEILSKALLLADDKKIKDPVILSQLRRP